MGTIAAILGGIGGLCAILGIITTLEVLPGLSPQLTWTFWFFLSALLLLGCIAFAVGRGGGYE
jgi:hypothetical protein